MRELYCPVCGNQTFTATFEGLHKSVIDAFGNPKDKHYIAAIKQKLIRDAQCYMGTSDPLEDESEWRETNGSVIVWDGYAESKNAVLKQLASLYNCSQDKFVVYQIHDNIIPNYPIFCTECGHEAARIPTKVHCREFDMGGIEFWDIGNGFAAVRMLSTNKRPTSTISIRPILDGPDGMPKFQYGMMFIKF